MSGGTHGENGKADFAGALHGGVHRAEAVFHVTGNIFNDHDGVIDNEARRNGERHEGQIIERIAATDT